MDPLNPPNNSLNQSSVQALEALESPYRVLLAVIYSITAVLAFFLNFFAAVVLFVKKRSSAVLRKHFLNLAFADSLIALFSIPFSYTDFMYGQWIFPLFLCPISNFISTLAVCLVIYTLIAIGIERYFAIVYPLRSRYWFESQTNLMIAVIWLLSITISSPLLFVVRAVGFKYDNQDLHDCRETWDGDVGSLVYTGLIFVMTFLLPLIALSFLYISIGVKTFKHIIPGNANLTRDEAQMRTKIKVVKMLCTLVVSFAICWMPLQIFNLIVWLLSIRSLDTRLQYYLYVCTYFLCHFLSVIHSVIDPLIYCFMSKNFKYDDIRSLLCFPMKRNGHKRSPNGISRTQTTLSRSQNDTQSQVNCTSLI